MTEREERLTLLVAITIREASAKVSAGPTDDDVDDAALPVWAGVIPARIVHGEPVANTDGAMASGALPVPPSVQRFLENDE